MMKIRKLFMVNFLIAIIVLSTVSFVSAKHAWWHPWGDEPREAPFDTTVTVSNQPPTIIWVGAVDEQGNGGPQPASSNVTDVVPACGLGAVPTACPIAKVSFIARDPNGAGDLQDTEAKADWIGPGTRFPTPATTTVTCTAVTLAPTFPSTGSIPGGISATTDKNYSCIFTMPYYYDPSATWRVQVKIKDKNTPTPNSAQCELVAANPAVDCPTFQFTTTRQIDTTTDLSTNYPKILWTNLNPSLTDIAADAPGGLNFYNHGNLDSGGRVTGRDIVPIKTIGVNDYVAATDIEIPSDRFGVSGTIGGVNLGACDVPGQGGPGTGATPVLVSGTQTPANIVGFSAPYGSPGSDIDIMYFCIPPLLSDLGLSDPQGYTSDPVEGGTRWDITAFAT